MANRILHEEECTHRESILLVKFNIGDGKATQVAKNGRPTKRKTLDDVAELARVSPITVSRALRNPAIVSQELRQRIESAVAKLGYFPNLAASRLASSRSHTVGVIVPTLYNVIFAEYLQAIHVEFLSAGFQVVVVNSRYSTEEEDEAVRTLLGQRVEAIIIVGTTHTAMTRRLLQRSRIPVIETFELTEDPINVNIGLSQTKAGYDATRFLIEMGNRRIGFGMGHHDIRASARLTGYKQAMEEANLSWEGLLISNPQQSTITLGSTLMDGFLAMPNHPDAIFFIDDNLALGASMKCRQLNRRVPNEISILGFHDLEFSAYASPSLSSVATHRYELGRLAAATAISMIKDGVLKQAKIDMGYRIVARQSTLNRHLAKP
jgi:LacI family gluconate utilization system Gnt-I transcriptional repressor